MSKKQSLDKLKRIIDDFTKVPGGMLYRNSFALACYLVMKGEVNAGKKMLECLFDVLGRERQKTYFLDIANSIEESAEVYAMEIGANLEINNLFAIHA